MTARIEWRSKGRGEDALVFASQFGEDDNTALKMWDANPERLTDFLNDMKDFDVSITEGPEVPVDQRSPQDWGVLIIARSIDGDVLEINPELYWDGIYYWFRSRGVDPHRMRQNSP